MRTLKMAQYQLGIVNMRLYERGSECYYRICQRNGYKALDMYKRCDKCMRSGATCYHDILVTCVDAGLTTGEVYEMVKGISHVLNFV